jgi:hypothetical protein
MKKIIVMFIMTLAFANGYSQEKGKFRVGLDLGFVPARDGAGGMVSIEPKYNLTDNRSIGLRFGGAGSFKDVQDNGLLTSAKISAYSFLVGTYEYYFHRSGSSFAPYLGAGLGYYSLANVQVDDTANSTDINPTVTGELGALVRAGFELGKFRMGLEYNLLPISDLENLNKVEIGIVSNTYLGLHLGFYLGGGKWAK